MKKDFAASTAGGRAAMMLKDPGALALYIDIDGTLLEMAPQPDAVRVPAGLVALLEDLRGRLGGALALLTGRRIADADLLFRPLRLIASGVHGTELRSEREGAIVGLAPPIPATIVAALHGLSRAPGVLVERKGSGIAVHYRDAPHLGERLAAQLTELVAGCQGLILRRGRMVLEIGPGGFSKGAALATLQSRPPFRGRRPVMVGDDAGDESALREAERLGGVALRVAGEHFSDATADFAGVGGVRAWLQALAGALRAESSVKA
jgi:trehalose 6-phosphate phosphatase